MDTQKLESGVPPYARSAAGTASSLGSPQVPAARFQFGPIFSAICEVFDVTMADLMGPCRSPRVSRPRQIAYWLTYKLTPLTYQKIGEYFGRDHTTVRYGVTLIDRLVANENDPWGEAASNLLDTLMGVSA